MQNDPVEVVQSLEASRGVGLRTDDFFEERTRPHRQELAVAVLVFSDVLLSLVVWGVALAVHNIWGQGTLTEVAAGASIIPNVTAWIGLRALLGLYPGYGMDEAESLRRQTYSVLVTLAITAVFAIAFQLGDSLSRLVLVAGFAGLLLLGPPTRHFTRVAIRKAGLWGKPVMILGSGQNGGRVREEVARLFRERWELGYRPAAVVDCRLPRPAIAREPRDTLIAGEVLKETLKNAMELARQRKIDTVVLAMPHTRREQLSELMGRVSSRFQHVIVIPNLSGITNSAVVARDFAGTFGVEIKQNLLDIWSLRTKRVVDLIATIVGGAFAFPLVAVLACFVYLESGGPVFYKDRRMGREDLFSCLKFRTMVPDAEEILQRVLEENPAAREEYARYHKLRDDPRVTRIGRFLRKTSLDELPQLWNVLRGDMSLVGPRPYLPRESLDIGFTQSEILRVPPGITGPWQVAGRNHTAFSDRVQMDVCYVRDWSVWLDLVILARTVRSVLFDRGAY